MRTILAIDISKNEPSSMITFGQCNHSQDIQNTNGSLLSFQFIRGIDPHGDCLLIHRGNLFIFGDQSRDYRRRVFGISRSGPNSSVFSNSIKRHRLQVNRRTKPNLFLELPISPNKPGPPHRKPFLFQRSNLLNIKFRNHGGSKSNWYVRIQNSRNRKQTNSDPLQVTERAGHSRSITAVC